MSAVLHWTSYSLVGSGSLSSITLFVIACAAGMSSPFGFVQASEGIVL